MTGRINTASAAPMDFRKIKAASKEKGITINDFVMSSLSKAMHKYLDIKGDDTTLNVLLPANVRF